NVSVVGILSADSLWSYPDFRVNERAYQLMEQVSGRAGRTDGNGTVWIQAFNTQHETLQWVLYHNLNAYYTQEITYRSHLGYPPFCRLIKIVFKHSQEQKAVNAAQEFTKKIATTQGIVIVGPAPAPVARVNNYYLYELWVKCPVNAKQLAEIKAVLVKERTKLLGERGNSNVQIIFDADPV
ncbi:MAG: primosomal protein N', partial [Chitinophagia bacterium]|nr:primosomal protein N' [Chitinophagia bacterium]